MKMKKKIAAVIAAFFIQVGGLYLIHSIWLAQDYISTADEWRTLDARNARAWAALLGAFIYAVGAVWIYARGAESKPWIGQGIRFGILLALVTVVYDSVDAWVMLPIPHMLVVKWIVGEGLLCIVFSLAIAAICQPKSTTV